MSTPTYECVHCGQAVVRHGWFWVLREEAESRLVSPCPRTSNGLHDVNEDGDDE